MNIRKLAITTLFSLLCLNYGVAQAIEITVLEDNLKSVGIKEAAHDFEKQTGIKVNVEEVKSYIYTIEKLRLDGPAGVAPDMMVFPHDQISFAAQENLIVPVDLTKAEKSKFLPSAVEAVTYKGVVYGIPKTVENLIVFYNKNYIKKPFETFEEYAQYNEDTYQKTHGETYGFVAKLDDLYYAYPFIKAFGGYVFSKNSECSYNTYDLGLNTQETMNAVNYMKNLYSQYHILADTQGKHESIFNLVDNFTSGKVRSVVTGPWDAKAFMQKGMKFGAAPLPKLPNGNYLSGFNGVRAYVINKYSKHFDACRQFAMFLNQPKYAKISFDLNGAPPALLITKDDPELYNNEIVQAVQTQFTRNEYMPNTPEMYLIWWPYAGMLRQIYAGDVEIKSGLDFICDELKTKISDYRAEHNL